MTADELATELAKVWDEMDRVNYWSAGERVRYRNVVGKSVRALSDIASAVNELEDL